MKSPEHSWRLSFLGIMMTALPAFIILRIILIQANPAQSQMLLEMGKEYENAPYVLTPARGQIFDRYGNVMAANKTAYEVGVELRDVKNPDTIALIASVVFGLDYDKVKAAAEIKPSKEAVYAVLTRFATQDQVNKLEQMKEKLQTDLKSNKDKNPPSLDGLITTPKLMRIYPEKEQASNIMGFVNTDGKGFYGVEGYFDDLLAGKQKTVSLPRNPNLLREIPEIPRGADLILTIDLTIQAKVEEILDKAIKHTGSDSGTIVVIDPKTGEILAMATTPRLDLNEYWRYDQVFTANTPFNRAISQAYEPGSVYKVLTMATGLDTGAVKPDTGFLDTGVFEIGGTTIYNWNYGAWGPQNMQGCLAHSLNVCLAWVASKIGAKDFYRYMDAFGIGHMTGVDMAGEATGRLKTPGDSDWYDADLGTNAFGQGVAATPLQMAAAASALANNGVMMAPHIVRSMIHDNFQHDFELHRIGVPIKADTAKTLAEMLARSLETESSDALVDGYRVAGKTGTAEIPTPYGYTSNQTNASFVGWGPVDDPKFLVYVWLEKPQTSIWGSEVASPLFKEVAQNLFVLMNIPPDYVRKQVYGN